MTSLTLITFRKVLKHHLEQLYKLYNSSVMPFARLSAVVSSKATALSITTPIRIEPL